MILLLEEGGAESVAVYSAKCGRRYICIGLEAHDFTGLSKLTPEALRDWFNYWSLGFPPGTYIDYRGQDETQDT